MKITVIEHTDVRGKKLNYIKIDSEYIKEPYLINVGEKTASAVTEIILADTTGDEELKKTNTQTQLDFQGSAD